MQSIATQNTAESESGKSSTNTDQAKRSKNSSVNNNGADANSKMMGIKLIQLVFMLITIFTLAKTALL